VSENFGISESELETNIFHPIPQPCQRKEKLIQNLFGEMKASEAKLKFWRRQLRYYVFHQWTYQ